MLAFSLRHTLILSRSFSTVIFNKVNVTFMHVITHVSPSQSPHSLGMVYGDSEKLQTYKSWVCDNLFSPSSDAWISSNASSADKSPCLQPISFMMFHLFESHFAYWSIVCFPIVFLLLLVLHLAVTQISNSSPLFQFRKSLKANICPTETLQRLPGNASKFCFYQHTASLLELFRRWTSFGSIRDIFKGIWLSFQY